MSVTPLTVADKPSDVDVDAAATALADAVLAAHRAVHDSHMAVAEAQRALVAAQAAATPVEPPAVVGVVVSVPGSIQRDTYRAGRSWDTDDTGALFIDDAHDRTIAEYPAGHWSRVIDLFAGE